MPELINADHQTVMVDGAPVPPGDAHEFTDEQITAGITGIWKHPARKATGKIDSTPVDPGEKGKGA